MADVNVVVRSTDQGSQNIQRFGTKLDGLVGTGLKVGAALGAMGLAFAGLERAAGAAWQTLGDGAALELANSRFENLAASIGTTADALKGDMAEATQGMMSNAQMVSAASDIISLGLADSGDEVVRLSNLVGQLGWDMQVLTLTMANDSMLRLDALGLSMEKVKARMEELKAAGMEAGEAFDLAVIEEGEAKLELLGSAAETTAGSMQKATASLADFTDNLKVSAVHLAEALGLFDLLNRAADTMDMRSQLIDLREAGKITQDEFNELFVIMRYGGAEAATKALDEMGKLKGGLEGVDNSLLYNQNAWRGWATGVAVAASEAQGKGKAAIDELNRALSAANTEPPEVKFPRGFAAQMDAALGSWGTVITDLADEAAEEHKEAADEIARAYEEAAVRMGQAFAGFAGGDVELFDFGDAEAMNEKAWDMAAAFGLTVEQAGQLGIALDAFSPEMAEAAAKAVLFQEAFGLLLGQFQAGNLDTSGLMAAYDQLIADMQSKSLVEIQVDLKTPDWAPTGGTRQSPFLPDFSDEPIEVPVTVKVAPTAADNALETALGLIDGIPDAQTKTISFEAEYAAVTPTATEAITTAISSIDGTVTMTPEAQEVYDVITALDESRLTVYVDFVQGSTPELPGKAAGGPVLGGEAYIIGERGPEVFVPWTSGNIVPNHQLDRGGGAQLSVQNYFYGPANAAEVARATDTAGRRLLELVRQAGVAA